MPLKLNVALSRKVGEPNYSSRGATVGLEIEVDSGLAHQPRQLHEQIARLFRLARQSVDRELGFSPSNGCRRTLQHDDPVVRPATANQVRAIHAIASEQNRNLADELLNDFGIERPEDLSLQEASQVIDALKSTDPSALEIS